jgi:DNA-binding PadR family transcriptional regulator
MAGHRSAGRRTQRNTGLSLATLMWAWAELPECFELTIRDDGEGLPSPDRIGALDAYYGAEYSAHTMNADAINSPLTLAVMGMLFQWPQSGYDLMKQFESTSIGNCSSSPGAVYPALKRLEEAGLIAGEVENEDTLRPRQVYHVTDAGKEALRECLADPVTRYDVTRNQGMVILRFVFAGSVLGSEEAARILTQFADEIEAYLPELEAERDGIPEDAPQFGRHALEHGIEGCRRQAEWARRLAADLRRRDKPRQRHHS